jgi:2',3'-cyclic-nucleotide 2'-phosphodiesterase (5'-nucleotidase family)
LARRATFYEESRKNADLRLIVDAGAFGRGYGEIGRIRNEYMAKGLAMLDYDVINLSVRDLKNGGEFIKNVMRDYKLKYVSANIHYKDSGKLFTEPYVIQELRNKGKKSGGLNRLKVGIIGLCEKRANLFNESIDEKMLESLDPVEAAKTYIPKVRKKCDIVVLLAHMNYKILEQVLSNVEGVDIVALGGGYYRTKVGSHQDSLIVVKTKTLGKYAGQLLLTLDQNKNIVSHRATEIALNEKIPDNPELAKLAEEAEKAEREYREKMRRKVTSDTKSRQKVPAPSSKPGT